MKNAVLDRQHDGLVRLIGRGFEPLGLQTLEPKAEAVALPIKYFHPVTVAIQKNKKHGVEHGDFDIQLNQLNQRSKAVDGFSEIHRLGVEVHFFDFGVGSHHEVPAPEKNWEHSIRLQLPAWNVGFMRRLHRNQVIKNIPLYLLEIHTDGRASKAVNLRQRANLKSMPTPDLP